MDTLPASALAAIVIGAASVTWYFIRDDRHQLGRRFDTMEQKFDALAREVAEMRGYMKAKEAP